jgi:hypothetical protein
VGDGDALRCERANVEVGLSIMTLLLFPGSVACYLRAVRFLRQYG